MFADRSTYHDCGDGSIIGSFRHKDTDVLFEFSENRTGSYEDYPHLVWVHGGYRYATVKKTVAHVVIDETDDGFVSEPWPLKGQRIYAGAA